MPTSKERDAKRQEEKEEGRPRRGDARAGYGKDPPPKGGRNSKGRGKGR